MSTNEFVTRSGLVRPAVPTWTKRSRPSILREGQRPTMIAAPTPTASDIPSRSRNPEPTVIEAVGVAGSVAPMAERTEAEVSQTLVSIPESQGDETNIPLSRREQAAVDSTLTSVASSDNEGAVDSEPLRPASSSGESLNGGRPAEEEELVDVTSNDNRSVTSSIFPSPDEYSSSEDALRQHTARTNMFLPEEFSGPRKPFRRSTPLPRPSVPSEPLYFPGWFSDSDMNERIESLNHRRAPDNSTRLIEFVKKEESTPIKVNAIVVELPPEIDEEVPRSESPTSEAPEVQPNKGKARMEGERPPNNAIFPDEHRKMSHSKRRHTSRRSSSGEKIPPSQKTNEV